MQKHYYLIVLSVAFASIYAVYQNDSPPIEKTEKTVVEELEEWDPVRGVWLAQSLEALSENRPIPDRMFPEDLTPYQMISLLPDDLRNKLASSSRTNVINTLVRPLNRESRNTNSIPTENDCSTLSARTYGDPHLVTFDGARYSFQTVGEFVLSKSTNGMEIQTRQKPEKANFSLNTAVAMNVGGDRVGFYASDYPDGNGSTPLRVNGIPVKLKHDGKHFLPNGGVIRKNYKGYHVVDWPTGESATVNFGNTSNMRFLNVNLSVSECGTYDGLLGNANGVVGDDFGNLNDQQAIQIPEGSDVFTGTSQETKQSRLAYIANALGDRFRITPHTSLFDYPAGTSTYTFTDREFPREHMTLDDVPEEDIEEARRRCREEAIANNDMNGCIFDQVYLEIEPIREPVVKDPTEGVVLRPVRDKVPNVNPIPVRPTKNDRIVENIGTDLSADPMEERNPIEVNQREKVLQDKERKKRDDDLKRQKIEDRETEERLAIEEEEERERRERLEQERAEEAEREKRERLEREKEAELQEKEQAEVRRREREREREATEKAEREQAQIEHERAAQQAREEREQKAKEKVEREKREAEARKKAKEKADAEAKQKREEAERKKKEAAAKKAREESERKKREEALKKSREGRR